MEVLLGLKIKLKGVLTVETIDAQPEDRPLDGWMTPGVNPSNQYYSAPSNSSQLRTTRTGPRHVHISANMSFKLF